MAILIASLYGKPCLLFDILFQGDTFYQLHDNVVDTIFLAHIIHIHDIWMHQSSRSLGLDPEFGYEIGIFAKFLLQNLDRYITVQLMTFCFIYIGHTTGTDLFQYFIAVSYHHSDL